VTRIAIASVVPFAVVLALGGCLDYEDDRVDFAEDFEGCGACTWAWTGEVNVVTTVHSGEHAARLGTDGVMVHDLQIVRALDSESQNGWDADSFTDGNWIEYSTDCAGTPKLAIEWLGADLAVHLRLAGPAGETFERRKLMFPPLPAVDPLLEMITFRRLTVDTAAPCRIDNLRVMVSGGTIAY
jgi:hypothetical protein